MKKRLSIAVAGLVCLLSACSKDDNKIDGGSPITDATQARTAFNKINEIWTATLKPALTDEEQTYTDKVIESPGGGKAIVNGSFSESNSSSSSGSSSSSIVDATVTFQQYELNGVRLDGVIRFYDSYRSRTACSSSGCASSTHIYLSYSSEGRSGDMNPPVNITFSDGGQAFKDAILLDANKEYSSWSVEIINGSGQTISFTY